MTIPIIASSIILFFIIINYRYVFYKSLQVTVMIGIVIFSLSFMLILIVLKSIFGVIINNSTLNRGCLEGLHQYSFQPLF